MPMSVMSVRIERWYISRAGFIGPCAETYHAVDGGSERSSPELVSSLQQRPSLAQFRVQASPSGNPVRARAGAHGCTMGARMGLHDGVKGSKGEDEGGRCPGHSLVCMDDAGAGPARRDPAIV